MAGNMQFLELGWPGFESWLSFFLVLWASCLPSLTLHFPICRMGASPPRAGSMTCNALSVSGGVRLPPPWGYREVRDPRSLPWSMPPPSN